MALMGSFSDHFARPELQSDGLLLFRTHLCGQGNGSDRSYFVIYLVDRLPASLFFSVEPCVKLHQLSNQSCLSKL
jgi:hypothetical protein